MKEEWTGMLLGKMHIHEITYDMLAKKLGVTKAYISMLLNGRRNTVGASERLEKALNELIEEKNNN